MAGSLRHARGARRIVTTVHSRGTTPRAKRPACPPEPRMRPACLGTRAMVAGVGGNRARVRRGPPESGAVPRCPSGPVSRPARRRSVRRARPFRLFPAVAEEPGRTGGDQPYDVRIRPRRAGGRGRLRARPPARPGEWPVRPGAADEPAVRCRPLGGARRAARAPRTHRAPVSRDGTRPAHGSRSVCRFMSRCAARGPWGVRRFTRRRTARGPWDAYRLASRRAARGP
jgi:hypothetical protein